jgi:hypothetical protein
MSENLELVRSIPSIHFRQIFAISAIPVPRPAAFQSAVSKSSASTGKASRAEVDADFVNMLQIRDGRVIKLVQYSGRDRALADLGPTD